MKMYTCIYKIQLRSKGFSTYTSWSHVSAHSHAPSFLFIHEFMLPSTEKKKVFPRELRRVKKKNLMRVYRVHTVSASPPCLCFSSLYPESVSSDLEDSVALLVKGSPHQHSCVWVVHCWSLEMQSSKRLSLTSTQSYHYWNTAEKAPVNQSSIWLAMNSTTRFNPPTIQLMHGWWRLPTVTMHKWHGGHVLFILTLFLASISLPFFCLSAIKWLSNLSLPNHFKSAW